MIQHIRQASLSAAPRRVFGVLLVVWLNLALLPCATAIEVLEEAHDCCPPSIELQQDCCELEALSVDTRDGSDFELEPSAATYGAAWIELQTQPQLSWHDLLPPVPGRPKQSINILHCVYLK